MDKNDVTAKLKGVFSDVFDNDEIKLHDEMTARDIDGWDSISNIRLMLSVEDAFGFTFDAGEISEQRNVGQLIDTILKRVS